MTVLQEPLADTATPLERYEESLRLRGLAENTRKGYAMYIRRFLDWADIDDRSVPSIQTYAEWINAMRVEGCGASSVKLRLAAGRSFYGFLGHDLAPLGDYKVPALPEPNPTPLPGGMTDVRRMLGATETTGEAALVALGGFAGLRVGESTSLRWAGIDFGNDELLVVGKGDRFRRVPMNPHLRKILESRMAVGPSGPDDLVVGITREAARRRIHRIGVDARIAMPIVNSHDLRYTFATVLYENTGRDVLMVSKLLGHSSIATTQKYLALSREETRAAVSAL